MNDSAKNGPCVHEGNTTDGVGAAWLIALVTLLLLLLVPSLL
jgi:hypothetical protein